MKAILFDNFKNHWVQYLEPKEIFVANKLDQVLPILEKVEFLTQQKGLYAVGFVSYEASPAFDRKLKVIDHESFPYCQFAIYEQATPYYFPDKIEPFSSEQWHSKLSEKSYLNHIDKIKHYIKMGDSYQVNYTYRLLADYSKEPLSLFNHLLANQTTTFSTFLEDDQYAICSASPELFFELDGNKVSTRPMKGTVKRGVNIESDDVQKKWLKNSPKNRAENTMIVDMIRNDLGKIAEKNTLCVKQLYQIETYKTALQMTSVIQAETQASLVDIFKAMFPCASITGAPKSRTMEIIQELEQEPRKVYTGCIGYIQPDRKIRFNVAIRTVLIDKQKQQAEFGVGGGIVWDSDGKDEFIESQIKAKILRKKPPIELLETMLWQKNSGVFLLDYHWQRLLASADYFNTPVSVTNIKKLIDEVVDGVDEQKQIIRLTINEQGKETIELKSFNSQKENKRIKLCFSELKANSKDKMLYHKTTNRLFYQQALLAKSKATADDVIILNEKNEVTETSIYNIVLKIKGELLTPKLYSGLLAGTMRQSLLVDGKIKESTLFRIDVESADIIYIINSVRKWQEAELVQ